MKKLIIAVMLALAVFTINAEVKQEGRVFIEQSKAKEVQPVQKTDYVYIDSKGESHPIYVSANGKAFVYMTSKKSGKVYKKYLPEVTKKLNLETKKKQRRMEMTNYVPGYLWAVFSDDMEKQLAEGFRTRQQAKHWACKNLPKEVKYFRVAMYRNTEYKVIKFRENTNLQLNEYRNNY